MRKHHGQNPVTEQWQNIERDGGQVNGQQPCRQNIQREQCPGIDRESFQTSGQQLNSQDSEIEQRSVIHTDNVQTDIQKPHSEKSEAPNNHELQSRLLGCVETTSDQFKRIQRDTSREQHQTNSLQTNFQKPYREKNEALNDRELQSRLHGCVESTLDQFKGVKNDTLSGLHHGLCDTNRNKSELYNIPFNMWGNTHTSLLNQGYLTTEDCDTNVMKSQYSSERTELTQSLTQEPEQGLLNKTESVNSDLRLTKQQMEIVASTETKPPSMEYPQNENAGSFPTKPENIKIEVEPPSDGVVMQTGSNVVTMETTSDGVSVKVESPESEIASSYDCLLCEKRYKSKTGLVLHRKTVHAAGPAPKKSRKNKTTPKKSRKNKTKQTRKSGKTKGTRVYKRDVEKKTLKEEGSKRFQCVVCEKTCATGA